LFAIQKNKHTTENHSVRTNKLLAATIVVSVVIMQGGLICMTLWPVF